MVSSEERRKGLINHSSVQRPAASAAAAENVFPVRCCRSSLRMVEGTVNFLWTYEYREGGDRRPAADRLKTQQDRTSASQGENQWPSVPVPIPPSASPLSRM